MPDLDAVDVYVCGAGPWAEAVERDLRASGLPRTAVHAENFSW